MFQVISEKALYSEDYQLFEGHFYMKIVVNLIPINLVTNWILFLFSRKNQKPKLYF